MKNKIILPLLLLFLVNYNAHTQTTTPAMAETGKASFGFFAGVNFQNINGKDYSGTKLSNSLVTKFNVGINEQIPVAPDFYVQIGLQYYGKGTKGSVPYNTTTVKREISLNYIEVPLNFLYKPLLGSGHFMLGFGPYFGYAFSGKAKFTGDAYTSTQNIVFAKEISASNPYELTNFKHSDVGANLFFGYEFANKITIVFNSQLGLIKINSKNTGIANNKLSEMNTGFGLNLGYRF